MAVVDAKQVVGCLDECREHLTMELLLTREGEPIWTHTSHSWKVNYHTVRCMVQCIKRLEKLLEKLQ